MKKLLLLFSLLAGWLYPPVSEAQVRYRSFTQADGSYVVRKESVPGSNTFDVVVSKLPSDAVRARLGGRTLLPYAPEAPAQFYPGQFNLGDKYFSPTFRFNPEYNPGGQTVAQLKTQGVNLFGQWMLTDAERATLGFGDAMLYMGESGFNQELEGNKYFECTLAQYEAKMRATLPACGYPGPNQGVKLLIFNIENSNDWNRGNYTGQGHWESWDACKNRSVLCESDGVTRTLQQIDDQNLWGQEAAVRRANRRIIMHAVAHAVSKPGLRTSDGSSMYQGVPRVESLTAPHGVFLDGYADVSHIGGVNGTITLNGNTYTNVSGQGGWGKEDVMTAYYYLFNFDISRSDYNDIWVNKVAGTQTYPYLWSKIKTRHIVADEKGYLQLNRMLMLERQGVLRPIIRMQEMVYEGDAAGVVDGTYPAEIHRISFPNLQGILSGGETPKIWQPHYYNYSRYAVTRFFAGAEDGWGYFIFPMDPTYERLPLAQAAPYQHHLHGYTAFYQARADMQYLENWYAGSTFVEDPEVQLLGSGSFLAYNGTQAYNVDGGTQHEQKPAYMLRYKVNPDGSTRVVILGGMNQNWTDERIDIVRVPSGGLSGNSFKIKLRGPGAQLYDFVVKAGDINQVYEATPVAVSTWEQPGYAGRVGVNSAAGISGSTSTTTTNGSSSTTTNGSSTTSTVATPAVSTTISYVNAVATSTFSSTSNDGGHHYDQFITEADYADYQFSAPIAAANYQLSLHYSSGYDCAGCGQGQYSINGAAPVVFPMDGAAGGQRTYTTTVALNAGTNTIRFYGKVGTYEQKWIAINRAAQTDVVSSTSNNGSNGSVSGNTSPPSWLTALRYSYDGTTLKLESDGSVGKFSLATSPATSFTINNPGGVPIVNNTFYGYGSQSVTGYPREWTMNHSPAVFLLTAQQDGNASATYSFTVPGTSATNVVLVAPTSSTVSNGTSNTAPVNNGSSTTAYNKPTFEPFDYTPITTNQSWPDYDNTVVIGQPIGEKIVLQNSQIKAEIWKRYGGTIGYISEPGGQNRINQNQDYGRGRGHTFYRYGRTRQDDSQNKQIGNWSNLEGAGTPGGGVGNDPIEIGDVFNNPSQVIAVGRSDDGKRVYVKSILQNWNVNNDPTDVQLEQWYTLDGPAIHDHFRVSFNRVNDKNPYDALSNEFPCLYGRGDQYNMAYADANGNILHRTGWNQTEFPVGEPWVATVDANDYGIGLGRSGLYRSNQMNQPGGTGPYENACSYTTATQRLVLDWNAVIYGHDWSMVGTVSQIRSYALSQPDPYNKFSWKFNSSNGRGHFWYHNCHDQGYPTSNSGIVLQTTVSGNYELNWPDMSVDPSNIQNVVIRYVATAGTGTASLFYGHMNQTDSQIAAQKIDFDFIKDGQPHSVVIPVSSAPNFNNGKISTMYVQFHNSTSDSRQTIQWINTTDADPEP